MATSSKTPPSTGRALSEPQRIAQLAEQAPLFAAQRWFARERNWINDQQLQLCRIPAATFFEQQRAEWFRVRLNELGWEAKIRFHDLVRLMVDADLRTLDGLADPSRD